MTALDPLGRALQSVWAENKALRADNTRLRNALTAIAERDVLLNANEDAFGPAAARRMQAQARAALDGTTGEPTGDTPDPGQPEPFGDLSDPEPDKPMYPPNLDDLLDEYGNGTGADT